jgi:hypothetical protein
VEGIWVGAYRLLRRSAEGGMGAVFIACLLLVSAALPVSAQPAVSRAEELYDSGRALVAAGKLVEACAAFEQSQQLAPAVTTLIALATCRDRLGELATAWELYLEAERRTRSVDDPVTAQLHTLAIERAAKLERRVPRLAIRVPDKHRSARLEILRDETLVPATLWNRQLPLNGGTYTITARAPGMNDWSTRVTLANESDSKTVEIPELSPQQTTPAPAPPVAERRSQEPEPAEPEPAAPPAPRGRALPIAVGAGAVALLGGALGFSLWSSSTYDQAKAEVTDQARRDSLYDSSNRQYYVAQGLAIAGAGCAGVAVWLYLRQRGAQAETSSARASHIRLTPVASGIGLIGQF